MLGDFRVREIRKGNTGKVKKDINASGKTTKTTQRREKQS